LLMSDVFPVFSRARSCGSAIPPSMIMSPIARHTFGVRRAKIFRRVPRVSPREECWAGVRLSRALLAITRSKQDGKRGIYIEAAAISLRMESASALSASPPPVEIYRSGISALRPRVFGMLRFPSHTSEGDPPYRQSSHGVFPAEFADITGVGYRTISALFASRAGRLRVLFPVCFMTMMTMCPCRSMRATI
jgi:hypothetical protein